MQSGIEPDDCFYMQNHSLMIGPKRINNELMRLSLPLIERSKSAWHLKPNRTHVKR